MSLELLTVLENIEREKGISQRVLIESVEAALVSAAKKVLHDKDKDVTVKIDLATGKINIYSDGKEIVSNEFGRIAAQTAKQVIFQKIREAERDVVFNEFHNKVDSIASGTVYRFEKGSLLVDLGKTEGVLPKREMSPRDNYRQGDQIHAFILEVNSPGLDRPLKSPKDFQRALGEALRIQTRDERGTVHTLLGKLTGLTELGIELESGDGAKHSLLFDGIFKATRDVSLKNKG